MWRSRVPCTRARVHLAHAEWQHVTSGGTHLHITTGADIAPSVGTIQPSFESSPSAAGMNAASPQSGPSDDQAAAAILAMCQADPSVGIKALVRQLQKEYPQIDCRFARSVRGAPPVAQVPPVGGALDTSSVASALEGVAQSHARLSRETDAIVEELAKVDPRDRRSVAAFVVFLQKLSDWGELDPASMINARRVLRDRIHLLEEPPVTIKELEGLTIEELGGALRDRGQSSDGDFDMLCERLVMHDHNLEPFKQAVMNFVTEELGRDLHPSDAHRENQALTTEGLAGGVAPTHVLAWLHGASVNSSLDTSVGGGTSASGAMTEHAGAEP